MPAQVGGFLHWRKERYVLTKAIASWSGDRLNVFAKSNDSGIYFCGIPFGAAEELREIQGRRYSGDGDTPFSEGRAMVSGAVVLMDGGEIACIGVSPTGDAVVIEFDVAAILDSSGKTRKLTGGLRCQVVPSTEFRDVDPFFDQHS
jgi:hypothetical protein